MGRSGADEDVCVAVGAGHAERSTALAVEDADVLVNASRSGFDGGVRAPPRTRDEAKYAALSTADR